MISSSAQVQKIESNPFCSKKIIAQDGSEKSLFKRGHGIKPALAVGANEVLFSVPYNWIKITGIEVIGAETGDSISLFVLDTVSGSYSGEANKVLNQFAFDLNVAEKFYKKESEYDADLYLGMQFKVVYSSVTAKTAYINFDLNEVK
jgi:hypothetical protein